MNIIETLKSKIHEVEYPSAQGMGLSTLIHLHGEQFNLRCCVMSKDDTVGSLEFPLEVFGFSPTMPMDRLEKAVSFFSRYGLVQIYQGGPGFNPPFRCVLTIGKDQEIL